MDLLNIVDKIFFSDNLKSQVDEYYLTNPELLLIDRMKKGVTRYRLKLGNMRYKPYTLSHKLCDNLYKKISVVQIRNLWDINTRNYLEFQDKILLSYESDSLTLVEPSNISNMIYNFDLTPLGLLAFRFSKYYGNEEFRNYVTRYYLKKGGMTKVKVGNEYFWVKNQKRKLEVEIINKMLENKQPKLLENYIYNNPNVFKWRD